MCLSAIPSDGNDSQITLKLVSLKAVTKICSTLYFL